MSKLNEKSDFQMIFLSFADTMVVFKTTYRHIFDHFQAQNNGRIFVLGNDNFPEFSRMIFDAILKAFEIDLEDLNFEEFVMLEAKSFNLAKTMKSLEVMTRNHVFFNQVFKLHRLHDIGK